MKRALILFLILQFCLLSVAVAQQKVGIGTTTPTEMLDVNGSIKADTIKPTAIQLSTGAGLNKVLTSDANGNASWQFPVGSAGNSWNVTGNSGTNTGTNFIGTADAVGLKFRIYNIHAGELSDTASFNTSFGFRSLSSVGTGNNNLGFGSNALLRNSSGSFNTGIGSFALQNNLGGEKNVAIGANALNKNLSSHNIAIGFASLFNDTTGARNIGIGTNSIFFGQSPQKNIAIGFTAYQFGNGSENVIVGDNAGQALSTGNKNIVFGAGAEVIEKNNSGAIGYGAISNQDSVIALGSASQKIAIARSTADEKLHVAGNIKSDSLTGTGNRFVFTDAQGKLFDSTLILNNTNGTVTSITAGTGLTGGTITNAGTISMPNVGSAGTFGSATQIPVITTDAQGRITNITPVSISATGADNWGTQVAQTNTTLSGNGTSASPLQIAQQGATSGQVLKWNGTSWTPQTDNVGADNWGTQSAQVTTRISGNGTSASPLDLAQQGATSGQVLKWNGTSWTPQTDNVGADNWGTQSAQVTTRISGNGTSASPLDLAQQGATSGQVLKWNGTTWAPANDSTGNNSNNWSLSGNNISTGNYLGTNNAEDLILKVNNTEMMHFVDSNRNVGIGISNPRRSFVIKDTNTYTQYLTNSSGVSGTDGLLVGLSDSTSSTQGVAFIWNFENTPLRLGLNNVTNVQFDKGRMQLFQGSSANTNIGAGTPNNSTVLQGNTTVGNTAGAADSMMPSAFNTYVGASAGLKQKFGVLNTYLGASSAGNIDTGSYNVIVGSENAYNLRNSNNNTILGAQSTSSSVITTASSRDNVFVGYKSAYFNTSGSFNTFIGDSSGHNNNVGSNNTFLGYNARSGLSSVSNSSAIGSNSFVEANNALVLGAVSGKNGATVNPNVGIGTSTPIGQLHVKSAFGTSPSPFLSAGNVIVESNLPTIVLAAPANGGAQIRLENSAAAAAPASIEFSPFYNPKSLALTSNRNALLANLAVGLIIDSANRVGIDTSLPDPASKLHVNGRIRIDGGNPGLNKILVSDANGLASWKSLNTDSLGGAWSINGNANVTNTNFLGTTAFPQINFKLNNRPFGYWNNTLQVIAQGDSALFNNSSGSFNLAMGRNALRSNTNGAGNIAIGNDAALNSNASFNVAIGHKVMEKAGTGGLNIAIGAFALDSNTTGSRNIAIGENTLYNNSTKVGSIAIGDSALFNNAKGATLATQSVNNLAIGVFALKSNTLGSNNIAIGNNVLRNNTAGIENIAIGIQAMDQNTTGNFNTAVGRAALRDNINGVGNTGFGFSALLSNNTGSNNTAVGGQALLTNTSGSLNVAVGRDALRDNSAGSNNTAMGTNTLRQNLASDNTAFGAGAADSNTTGTRNVAIGRDASRLNETGSSNVAIGVNALLANLGDSNIAVGDDAMSINTTGERNTALGYNAEVSAGTLNNATVIGNSATVNASNKVRLGNTTVTVVEGQVAYTFPSDARFKYNVQVNVPGLSFINRLKPVTYQFDTKKFDLHLNQNMPDSVKSGIAASNQYDASSNILHTGFLAQDIEKICRDLNYNFDGVHLPESKEDNYSVAYTQFVMPLVKAVQELDKKAAEQQAQIELLRHELELLKQQQNTH